MRFTEQEIVFLTSVSRGRKPFGVTYTIPEKERREACASQTLDLLVKKGILDGNRKLTEEGAAVIRFWEQYRNCRRHIRLNHMNIAVLPGDVLLTVIKTEDGYEAGGMRAAVLMCELLKQAEYLCLEDKEPERGRWQDMTQKEWEMSAEEAEGAIVIREYHTGRLESEKVYFWKGGEGLLYHKTRGRARKLSPGIMRRQIYRMLEEEEENGRQY